MVSEGFASKVEIPPTAVGGSFKSGLHQAPLMMKIPPTAVGGLFKSYLLAPRR